ncbi:MAG: hypothetical protein R3282_07725, partial [Rhodothermales bacterium]|nr:hypothetical protein [Rhodothermales bacterium]
AAERHWGADQRKADFFDIKGSVSSILSALKVEGVEERALHDSTPATSFRVEYMVNEERIGVAAMLHPDRTAAEGIDTPVYFAEMNWTMLLEKSGVGSNAVYQPISRFPTVERDLAFVVGADVKVGPVVDTIKVEGGTLLSNVGVFDVYQGSNVGTNKKSIAFSLRFSSDRTLTDAEVDKQIERIVAAVRKGHAGELRD